MATHGDKTHTLKIFLSGWVTQHLQSLVIPA